VVKPRRRNAGMPQPLLHLGDIGLVIKRVGRRSRSQRMRADSEAERRRISARQLVNAIRRYRSVEIAGRVVAERPKEGAVVVVAVSGGFDILVNARMRVLDDLARDAIIVCVGCIMNAAWKAKVMRNRSGNARQNAGFNVGALSG
jgi:hypothetical protein